MSALDPDHDVITRVRLIVADALSVPVTQVTAQASLIDDLGAESIDFLDVLFRVESEFSLKIREDEMWAGTVDRTSPDTIQASMTRLRATRPDFDWDRFPADPTHADLARLITVTTIVDYLRQRGIT